MRKIHFWSLILFFLASSTYVVKAQNFVPNPGFELNTGIPTSVAQWWLCQQWSNCGSGASPDYFHSSANGIAGIPATAFGTLQTPIGGNAVMGICPWYPAIPNYREYMSIQLNSPLTKGTTYQVSFKVTNALAGSGYSINKFGIHFSPGPLTQTGMGTIPVTPQWTHGGQLQSPGWKLVTFYYKSDSNYTHMTVGNFHTDAQTAAVPWRPGSFWAYYFVDDFMVVEKDDMYIKGDSMICNGDSVHLVAKNDTVIKWVDINDTLTIISTDSTLDTVLTQTTTFIVYGKHDTDTVTVTVINYPVVNLGNDTTICMGQGLILSPAGVGNYTYLWNNGSTNPNLPVPPNQNGTYSVTVTASICGASDTIVITYAPIPILDLGPDTTLCPGDSILLNAGYPNSDYLWHDGSTDSTYMANQAGLYWVTVSDTFCSDTDSVTINYYPGYYAGLGNDTTICPGQSVTLFAGGGFGSYLWSDGSTDSTLTVTTGGTYWVNVGSGPCTFGDTIVVNIYNPVPIDLGPDTSLCPGQTLTLDAGAGNTNFLWQDGSTQQTFFVSAAGQYYVSGFTGICYVSDTINVNYYIDLTPNLGPDTSLCPGDSIVLNAGTMGTFVWSDGTAGATLPVGSGGTYSVTVTGPGNCVFSDTMVVTMNPQPVVNLGPDTVICAGYKLTLDAGNAGSTFLWNDGSTSQTISFVATQTQLHWVTVTNSSGCTGSDSIFVNVLYLLTDLGPDFDMCEGTTAELKAGDPGADYLWQDGSTGPTYTVDAPGSYEVTVTMGECTMTDGIEVTMTYIPVTDLGPDSTLCEGESMILDAGNTGTSYSWNLTQAAPRVEVSQTGTYHVEVANECGTDEDTIQVKFENCDCQVWMPNAFTPNGDQQNDILKPTFNCNLTDYQFQVFDRWGKLVYQTSDVNSGWDGRINGVNAPEGVFVYSLIYSAIDLRGRQVPGNLAGSFTLLR